MNGFRRLITMSILGGVAVGTWFVGAAVVQDMSFARTQQEVDASRTQIQSIQDLAAAFRAVGRVIEPSVVKIDVRKTVRTPNMLKRFFQDHPNMAPDAPNMP